MQNRIDRLEGLVLSLMTNGSSAAGPSAAAQAISGPDSSIGSGSLGPNLDGELEDSQIMDDDNDEAESETDGLNQSFGILKVDQEKQKTYYVGEAHWAALLNEIGEVKNYFVQHKNEYEAQMEKVAQTRRDLGADAGSGPALLFGATIPPSRAEILAQIPSRYMSDILIGRYFNTFDPATHILHGPTFQRQYNAHWQDSSKTSIVWIAMFFAMMRLAMLSYGREGDEPPEFRGKCQDMAVNFRTQMAHCLILADYTKPHNHIIETLIFHLHAEYTSNRDAESSVWVLCGMITRLSMRMGYHRDPKLFPNLTAFQGEMRRRIWTFVRSADLLFSFQVALPSMIRIGDSDTELPNNLFDDEFDENSTTLPPSRPPTEATPISYMIAKGRLSFGFGRVLEEVNEVNKKGYDEVLKIDRGLRDIYDSIPEYLKLKPMREMSLAPISLIMARFSLATVYHKSQCVLHRRYMRLARGNNRYMYSRRSCLDSAMQLLNFQSIQHQASQERGRLRSVRSHVNSLTTHDYLLAATVVCMDLYNHRERPEGGDVSTPSTSVSGGSVSQGSNMSNDGIYVAGLSYTRDGVLRALEESREVWVANRDLSMEAYKASELLNVLLQSLRLPYSSPAGQNGSLPPRPAQQGAATDEQSAAMTLGMLQSGGLGPSPSSSGMSPQSTQQGQWDGSKIGSSMFGAGNDALAPNPFGPGAANAPSPFPSSMFGLPDFGNSMNLDWVSTQVRDDWTFANRFVQEAWDQYMQPSNPTLDPAANLWGSGNSPNQTMFTQTSSPDSNNNSDNFGMNSSYYAQNIGSVMGGPMDLSKTDGPTLTATSTNSPPTDNSAGEVFMGVASPQPGGIPSWKWTVMNDKK